MNMNFIKYLQKLILLENLIKVDTKFLENLTSEPNLKILLNNFNFEEEIDLKTKTELMSNLLKDLQIIQIEMDKLKKK